METVLCEKSDGIAWVTLNRPEVLNAFNTQMQDELRATWIDLRKDNDVRVVVLGAAGERAFCVGVDRNSVDPREVADDQEMYGWDTPWTYDDPGRYLGPKANDMWKPVIAAVQGMACGGAFYLLGEVEFIIAADTATFFDPHVTYGQPAVYEPIHMAQRMPFQEIMRMSLLGNHERMSAKRAFDVGLVSEVVPVTELHATAEWAAQAIASAPSLAMVATVRALWSTRDLPRHQALDAAYLYVRNGISREAMEAGQEQFASGQRIKWRLR
jgi:enoyl-CoA hydratase/carnithine racemase